MSVGNNPISLRLDSNTSSLILGQNGAGKSCFLDAVTYGLYGKPYRDINKPALINSINGANLLVEIEFETNGKQYLIRRGMKPNIFEIYEDENLINQDAKAFDYQAHLEKHILRMNHKAFTQIVILGKVTYIPFMNLKPMQRREVIEEFLDLVTFTNMNEIHKVKVKEHQSRFQEVDYNIRSLEDKIEFVRTNLAKVLLNTEELINDKKTSISELISKGKLASEQALNIKKDVDTNQLEYNSQSQELKELQDAALHVRSKVLNNQKRLAKELNFFDHTSSCPTCSQTIDESYRDNMIKTRRETLDDYEFALTQIDARIKKFSVRKDLVQQLKVKLQSLEAEYRDLLVEVKSCKNSISAIEKEIKILERQHSEQKVDSSQINDLQTQLSLFVDEKKQLLVTTATYQLASQILKDSGLKAQFIRKVIPKINKYIERYLSTLDFFVQFELDENFNEIIKSRYRDTFTYNSFSEGEKFRIDLALLMVWRLIARERNSCTTNLLILDEIFDSSLDTEGTEALMTIINELTAEGQTVFVISHRDNLSDNFDNTIRFEKNRNFTQLVEQ